MFLNILLQLLLVLVFYLVSRLNLMFCCIIISIFDGCVSRSFSFRNSIRHCWFFAILQVSQVGHEQRRKIPMEWNGCVALPCLAHVNGFNPYDDVDGKMNYIKCVYFI